MKKNLRNASAFVGMCLLFFAVHVSAATLTVDTTNDSGIGSLRQALIDATSNAEANNIVFAIPTSDPNFDKPTNRFTITLMSALPDIPLAATNITNSQPQAITIRGNNTFRIFTLVNSAVVVMTNVTISNGGGQGITANGDGGAIYMGDSGTLTINDCTLSNSSAVSRGGGIFMNNSGTIHMNRSTLSGNSGSNGGAIFVNTSGTLNLNTSTLSGNSATVDYGGAFENYGTVNAMNNTFSGNFAASVGGAIINWGTMTLTSNTIVENESQWGGGIYNTFSGTATLNNNIIALNVATSGGRDLHSDNPSTGTYNLIGVIDGSSGLDSAPNIWGSVAGGALNPMIGPLQNNGGPTFTRALLTGSPAQDKGNSPGVITDQRGYNRPYDRLSIPNSGDGSDIGAFELLGPSRGRVSVGGRVLTSAGKGGRGISGVVVSIEDSNGNVRMARTNLLGYYQILDVLAGSTYVLSAQHKLHQFEATSVSVYGEISDLDWTPIN